jgi:hypothetical protein
MKKLLPTFGLALAFSTGIASAQSTFQAILNGASEVPVNGSTATGFGTVVLNAAETQITVNETWTGLIGGPATASHIHGPAAPGVSVGVLFPFSGVPSAISGSIPEQVFAITATQVGYLRSGLLYMNVHDATFGGGEIRGQLTAVPEPGTMALLGLGLAAAGWSLRRRFRA